MWRTNLTVALIVVGTLGLYTAVANIIPQVESDVPEELVLGADVSAEELVTAGEQLYAGGGGCTACHGLGTRAPDLLGVAGTVCGERKPDLSCKEYLHESMVDPGAYVVDGFQPIMPDMRRTLSDTQIWSLVAYLESQGGEVTVTADDLASTEEASSDGGAEAAAPPTGPAGSASADPAELVVDLGCTACHAYGEAPGGIGPAMADMSDLEPEYIRRSILDPAADVAEGYEAFAGTMPATFGNQLTATQLEILVDFIAGGATQ